MKKIFFIFLAIFYFLNCTVNSRLQKDQSKIDWLIGTWENKTNRGSIYETWSKSKDYGLNGMSYMLKDNDTIVFENIRLLSDRDTIFYIPTVKNQNSGLPVKFACKTMNHGFMVFENLQHDFPQRISYTKINADSLFAEISGIKNGKERRQVFPMIRK